MMKDAEFKIFSDVKSGIPVVYMQGDITSDSHAAILEHYQGITKENHKNIILNFTHTSYINSAGIATLINIITDITDRDGKIIFVNLSSHFQKVMDIVGLTDFVNIYGNNEEGLAAFGVKN